MKIKIMTTDYYPFYQINKLKLQHCADPSITVTHEQYEWICSTMTEFAKVQKFLQVKLDRKRT